MKNVLRSLAPLVARLPRPAWLALVLMLVVLGCAQRPREHPPAAEVGSLRLEDGLELRRLVVHHPRPKGTVLFLHGFPETIYAWKDIALALGNEYEVHAFDWPGFGQSSRPAADRFAYAPHDYARVLKGYIAAAGLDRSKLLIYATDIGALPALLLALQEPDVARGIIVGDFAPFDRPQYMHDNLQGLKARPTSDAIRAAMNRNRDEILENAWRRGLPEHEQFDLPRELKEDMRRGWSQDGRSAITSADAFYHYYSHFSADQRYFESNLARLKTPVEVVWGEKDFYISKDMGAELASRTGAPFKVLPMLGHYPHLQHPRQTVEDVRTSFARR